MQYTLSIANKDVVI